MPAVDYLPPELLRHIFCLLATPRNCHRFEDHRQCRNLLASCALVHSSWRSIAQQLLVQEVWVSGEVDRHRTLTGAAQPPFDTLKVQSLTVEEASLERIVEKADQASEVWRRRWEGITFLELINGQLTERALAPFRNLRVLTLYSRTHWATKKPTEMLLPELRRLIIGLEPSFEPYFDFSPQDFRHAFLQVFTPAKVPRLVHLSFFAQCIRRTFMIFPLGLLDNILSQVETIAIANLLDTNSYSTLIQTIASCSNLRHLALAPVHGYTLRHLAEDAAGLDLDSLHVCTSFSLDVTQEDLEQLFVEQDRPGRRLHVRSLVVYGPTPRSNRAHRVPVESYGAKMRWGIGARPPFETFDGTE